MKTVNNQQIRGAYARYQTSNKTSLMDCYNKWSTDKFNAWRYCRELQEKYNGFDGKLVSHNSYMFTYGFTYKDGQDTYFVYITPTYDYRYKIN